MQHKVLPDEQFGFLSGRSAKWQLLSVLEDWHACLDSKSSVHAVFLDAAKAFDRVNHADLLSKLAEIGVRGPALKWFHCYFTGRRISTKVDGVLYDQAEITSGVPQGSILGPLLFLIYFKDIPAVVRATSALFADDTLLYWGDCMGDRSTPCCGIQDDLDCLSKWATASGVRFNASKSAELCLGNCLPICPIELDGSVVPRASAQLHLGVHID